MHYVIQYCKGSVYVLDHEDTYQQAMAKRDQFAEERPSRWYEVIDSSELANLFL
jgi:hypothetical protein